MKARLPPSELERLRALQGYGVMDTPAEKGFDDITALAAKICNAPIALISLIDGTRQWFKSRVGLDESETSRDISFCGHTILQPDLLIVPSAESDERFADNPLVTGELGIRFYAGAPLVTQAGHGLGALCIMDRVPRELSVVQKEALGVLSRQVMAQLELRRQTRELAGSEKRLQIVTENARVGLVIVNRDRHYIYANTAYTEILGLPSSSIVGLRVPDVLAEIYEEQIRPRLDRAFAGERVAYELRKPVAGGDCFYAVRYEPTRVNGAVELVVVVITDVTERARAEIISSRLAAIVESSDDAMIGKDLSGIITSWNKGAEKIFGYRADEMVGTSIMRLIPADRADEENHILGKIRHGESVEHFETLRQTKNGRLIDVSVTVSPIRNAAGKVIGVSKVARDITRRKLAEGALRDSELRFSTAFQSSPAALTITRRRDMVHLAANDAFLRIFECARDEVLGKTLHQLGLLDPETLRSLTVELNATGIVQNREITARTCTGRPVHAILSVKVIELGGEMCSLSILVDITDRKLAEEKLRLHEAVLRETGHIAKVGGWSFEVATGEGYWTDEVARIHDLDPAVPVSKDRGLSFYRAESRKRIEPALQEAVQHGKPYDLELEITSAAGAHKWVRTIGHPVMEEGKVVRLRGSFQDITERKRAELRLILQHAVSVVLAEGAPMERTGRAILETLGKGLGWDLGELWKVDKVHNVLRCSEVWHPPSTEFSDFIAASESTTFERGHGLPGSVWASGCAEWSLDIGLDCRFVRRPISGQLGLHGWIGFPIMLRNEVLGVVGFFSAEVQEPDDELLATLTELGAQLGQYVDKLQLAEQFRQAQKMDAIGTLAGGIAHDFNNLLAIITGYTELIQMTVRNDPKLLKYLESIATAGLRATKLVGQILTFSRREEFKREIMQLGPVVDEALKFLRSTIPSVIEFNIALAGNTPAVLADATQIHQIVMNLCTNAWHAMKDRPGRLEVKLENFEVDAALAESQLHVRPGRYVRLSVSDTGKGMDPVTMSRIFEPFFTTKGPNEGTGLGLSVVHGIMQGHEGAVTVYSQPGEGTTFHLYFPTVEGEVLALETDAAPIPRGNGERILFVDDEEPLVLLTQRILVQLGYVVEARALVMDGLDLVRARPDRFDLVITDMTMPVMSGIEFAQRLAQLRPDLPVILTTGYPGGLKLEQIRAMGIRELLAKPPTIRALGTAVHRVLNEDRANG